MVKQIVDLPIEHGDFPVRYVTVCQRVPNAKKDKHGNREKEPTSKLEDNYERLRGQETEIFHQQTWRI
jgi:hypothetical protein